MRIGNDSVAMRPGAPTRLDRAVLAVASGPVGHLYAALRELVPAVAAAVRHRLAERLPRRGGR
jgi:hypothetical protein